jgi:hypothetical protein
MIPSPHPASTQRDVRTIRHDTRGGDAMDAMPRQTNAAVADGQIVWS